MTALATWTAERDKLHGMHVASLAGAGYCLAPFTEVSARAHGDLDDTPSAVTGPASAAL